MKKSVKLSMVVFVLFSVFAGIVYAGDTVSGLADAWAPHGKFPTSISILQAVPGNHAKVYAGCTNGFVYVTENAYNPEPVWTRIFPVDEFSTGLRIVTGIAVNPNNNAEIYISFNDIFSGAMLLKSADYGNTFTKLEFPGRNITGISVNPLKSEILYLVSAENIYISMDSGNTWQIETPETTLGIPLSGNDRISCMEQIAYNTNMVFAGTEKGDLYICSYIHAANPYWYKITSAQTQFTGKTITSIGAEVRSGMPVIYLTVKRDMKDLFTSSGIFRSINGGTAWESIHNPDLPLFVAINHISVHPYYMNYLYAVFGDAFGTGIFFSGSALSTDKGDTWELSFMR